MTAGSPGQSLMRCPRCELIHPPSADACAVCGSSLVAVEAGGAEIESLEAPHGDETFGLPGVGGVSRGEKAAYARRIDPELARGELRRVTGARNLAEAELIQGMLIDQGVPSLLRRTRGFDVPDFIAAGPRDVFVPESGYEQARTLLAEAAMLTREPEPGGMPGIGSPGRLALGLGLAFAGAFALVWVLYQLAA